MSGNIDERLVALGIELPVPPAPAANYVPYTIAGKILTISGQVTMGPDGLEFVGKLGDDMDVETGQKAAQACAINILAQAKAATGDLEKIRRLVKITVFVASQADFTEQHLVANGASDLLAEALGDRGVHARSAVGVASLPLNAPVEIEAIFEIDA